LNIQHTIKNNKGVFSFAEHGDSIAEMVYETENDKTIVIVHTEVKEEFEGKGIGQKLVDEAVKYARENLIKIKATCVFAKNILQRNSEYHDVYIH
jgi:predicted GNAT family acetyltransferase